MAGRGGYGAAEAMVRRTRRRDGAKHTAAQRPQRTRSTRRHNVAARVSWPSPRRFRHGSPRRASSPAAAELGPLLASHLVLLRCLPLPCSTRASSLPALSPTRPPPPQPLGPLGHAKVTGKHQLCPMAIED